MLFRSPVETAKVDAIKEHKESHAYIDFCVKYYGVGVEDCLKQVKSNYPHLDLVKVSMDANNTYRRYYS